MVKKHLKALAAPVTWPIKRKGIKFVLRPKPGKRFDSSMPVALVFKTLLKYCKTMREVKSIMQDKEILVDGKRTKEPKALLGLMDTLSLPVSNEYYRLLISKSKKLFLLPIQKEEANHKLCKIMGKTTITGGKIQINLFDGRNLIVKETGYKVGDSVMINLPDQKVKSHFSLAAGSLVFIISGSHVGEHGEIISINKEMLKIKTKTQEFETPKDTIMVIGKGKSEIKLE